MRAKLRDDWRGLVKELLVETLPGEVRDDAPGRSPGLRLRLLFCGPSYVTALNPVVLPKGKSGGDRRFGDAGEVSCMASVRGRIGL